MYSVQDLENVTEDLNETLDDIGSSNDNSEENNNSEGTTKEENNNLEGTTIELNEEVNKIKEEEPDVWTEEFEQELTETLKQAVDLEIEYAKDVIPRGILGLNSDMFIDYMQFIANRRLESLNMKFRYKSDKNPFPWLSETIDLDKQKNFFETKVTEYQSAGALDDDF